MLEDLMFWWPAECHPMPITADFLLFASLLDRSSGAPRSGAGIGCSARGGVVDQTIGRKRVSCWAVPAYEGRIASQGVSPDRGVLVLVLDCQGRTTTGVDLAAAGAERWEIARKVPAVEGTGNKQARVR
ncbi:hypothetical protein CKAH01_05833 [Colletotrichum kahawae]|uniref:Uncharacterized protein n=1 Tax=Colletotrichum kahawae TaxID=34407 RepID=A0AAE0D7B3_COLKA|nr:hypothetical protein CKAH01_05833 [Colletotrichum kahawae]